MTTSAESSRTVRRRIHLGTAVRETLVVLRHDGVLLTALALVLYWLPPVVEAWLKIPQLADHAIAFGNWAGSAGTLGAKIVFETVLDALITRMALDRLSGAAVAPGAAFRAVLPLLPVLLLIGAASGWASIAYLFRFNQPPIAGPAGWAAIGLAALVSDCLVVLILGVLTPVIVTETGALGPALSRTTDLMRAGRWTLLGVVLGLTLLVLGADVLIQNWLDPHHPGVLDTRPAGVVRAAFEKLPATLALVVMTVFTAAFFRGLRAARGELTPGEIADAFD